mgnify:CR=1 FL=1
MLEQLLKIITSMVPKKKNKISLIIQEGKLKSLYPDSKVIRNKEKRIKWECNIQPTPLSGNYKVQLVYETGKGVEVFIKEPFPLKLAENTTKLPHVYSTEKQRLCLYYPTTREWHYGQLYTDTIIPWTCEWLAHYEIWVSTGVWFGGGIHIETEKKDDRKE